MKQMLLPSLSFIKTSSYTLSKVSSFWMYHYISVYEPSAQSGWIEMRIFFWRSDSYIPYFLPGIIKWLMHWVNTRVMWSHTITYTQKEKHITKLQWLFNAYRSNIHKSNIYYDVRKLQSTCNFLVISLDHFPSQHLWIKITGYQTITKLLLWYHKTSPSSYLNLWECHDQLQTACCAASELQGQLG